MASKKKRFHTLVLTDGQVQRIVGALFEQAMREDFEGTPSERVISALKKISDKNAKDARKRK